MNILEVYEAMSPMDGLVNISKIGYLYQRDIETFNVINSLIRQKEREGLFERIKWGNEINGKQKISSI